MSAATDLDGLVYGLDEQEYHALPGLSSTGAKTILRSPAHYDYQRKHGRPEKPAFDMGHAAHADVLGTGLEVVRIDADDWRTKDARAERDTAYAAGKVPLLAKDADRAAAIAAAVRAHDVAGRLFATGDPEVSAFWTDEATGVPCRGRFDYLRHLGRPLIVDLKTCQDANPDHFGRTALNLGYDVQTAHYLDGYQAITGETAAFVHVLVEVEPPHAVSVVQLDDDALYVGGLKARRAREIWRDCTAAGVWPAYSTEIEPVSLPAWAVRDAEERYA
jgi:hypothetical protein